MSGGLTANESDAPVSDSQLQVILISDRGLDHNTQREARKKNHSFQLMAARAPAAAPLVVCLRGMKLYLCCMLFENKVVLDMIRLDADPTDWIGLANDLHFDAKSTIGCDVIIPCIECL